MRTSDSWTSWYEVVQDVNNYYSDVCPVGARELVSPSPSGSGNDP